MSRTFKNIEGLSPSERLRREIPLLGATDKEVMSLNKVSLQKAGYYKNAFKNLKTYCMFIGYPRSGHSIIGSVLDAHPNIVIAHELDALRFLKAGFNESQIYYLLIENSRLFTQHGCRWGRYGYVVPNQWQGTFTDLTIIGDKKGGMSTVRIARSWRLFEKLIETVNLNIKFIHVIRNPFDNITTLAVKQTRSLTKAMQQYFNMCRTNSMIISRVDETQVFELHHNGFIDDPQQWLSRLCNFLGVETNDDYLNACASIVFKQPHQSRHKIEWSQNNIDIVHTLGRQFEFLQRYSFDN